MDKRQIGISLRFVEFFKIICQSPKAMAKKMIQIYLRRPKDEGIEHLPPSLHVYGMNAEQKKGENRCSKFANFLGYTTPCEMYRFIFVYSTVLAAFIILLCLKLLLDPSNPGIPNWFFVLLPLSFLVNTIAGHCCLRCMDGCPAMKRQEEGTTRVESESCSTPCVGKWMCKILPLSPLWLIGWGLCMLGAFLSDVSFLGPNDWIFAGLFSGVLSVISGFLIHALCYDESMRGGGK
jgi:hypothetical protein